MGCAFFLWVWKAPRIRSTPLSLVSREGTLVFNSLFLFVGLATLVLGTLYPLWTVFMGQGPIAVGAPYFERTFIPLMLPFLLLIPLGGLLREKREPLLPLVMAPFTATLGALTLLLYFFYPASLLALVGLSTGVWILGGTLTAFLKKRLSLGSFLAHMGVAISLLGISMAGGFRKDEAHVLRPQENMRVGNTTLTLQGVQQGTTQTYLFEKATLEASGSLLTPEKRFYQPQNSLLSETAIQTNGLRDLYVTLGPYQGEDRWVIRASIIPLAPSIWIGGALMVLGAGVSFYQSTVIASFRRKRSSPGATLKTWVASLLTLLAMTIEVRADTLDQRAQALSQEVRCPVCLGQSIAESETPESRGLKKFILERLKKGDSEETIRETLRRLYGNEILFRPPFESHTLFLWLAPFGFLLCVLFGLVRRGLIKR